MLKIGMIVALEAELIEVISELGELTEEREIYGMKLSIFRRGGAMLYLLKSGVGEINAAIAAMTLITKYEVSAIINFGVVGALKHGLKAGDVVAVNEVVHYEFSSQLSDNTRWGRYVDTPDTFVFKINDKAGKILFEELGIKQVRIASGDKFVDNSNFKKWLIEYFGCDICDMESAGLILACNKTNTPLFMIKAVSDSADESANEDFAATINKGVHYYTDAVKQIVKRLEKEAQA